MKKLFIFWDEPLNITGGGVHRTINALMSNLPKRGIDVYYLYSLDKYKTFHYKKDNKGDEIVIDISELRSFLIENRCSFILGQEGGFSDTFTRVVKDLAIKDIKFINQYHTSLLYFDKKLTLYYLWFEWLTNKSLSYRLGLIIRAIIYPIWKYRVKQTQKRVYRFNYTHSDISLLLSGQEKLIMAKITGDYSLKKCISIPNPLSWQMIPSPKILEQKKKEVLIVSRIYNTEKRIDLALKVWGILQKRGITENWTLRIVGDGNHKDYLKNLAGKMHLNNVIWEHRCDPLPYYESASIFLLTSVVEGWALTLTESMQMGVVPVAFDSYPAVKDIITDGYDGFLIPNGNVRLFAIKLSLLMQTPSLRYEMAKNGLETCSRFSIDNVMNQWEQMFKNL